MGADDRDESSDSCIEHVWVEVGVDLTAEGAYVEHACARCPAVSIETPADLRGQ